MRIKEKNRGKDEIKSVFLRGYVWHKSTFTSCCYYSTILTITSPVTLLSMPSGVSILISCASVFFLPPSLSSFSCISVLKEASKPAIFFSLLRMGVHTRGGGAVL